MKSILEKLYFGRIAPWERRTNRSEERRELGRKIEDEKRYFIQKMSLDDCQRFQALDGLYSQANEFEQIDAFSSGFKLGIMLMCAVFMDDDEPPRCEK